jgi:hypothetical protein
MLGGALSMSALTLSPSDRVAPGVVTLVAEVLAAGVVAEAVDPDVPAAGAFPFVCVER